MIAEEPLCVEIFIAAPATTVFGYFTDPSRYVQWMGSRADLEPVPGGIYRVVLRDGLEVLGRFVEVDPPHRVEFTWGWTNDDQVPPGSTRVVVTLHPRNGGTLVRLRHLGLPAERRGIHDSGWHAYLERLRSRGAGEDPGVDPNAPSHPAGGRQARPPA